MGNINYSRMIRALDSLSKNELQNLRNEIDKRIGQSNSVNEDDLELFQVGSGSMLNLAREQRDRYKRERDKTLSDIAMLTRYIEWCVPTETIFGDAKYEDGVMVGVSIVFRHGGNAEDWEAVTIDKVFMGSLEDAKNAVLPQVVLSSAQVPFPSDIAGHLDGVTEQKILDILHNLAPYRYGLSESEYQKRRLEAFETVYHDMMEVGIYGERNHARTRFNQVIDGSFKNAEARQKAITRHLLPSPTRNE